jgi:hypothetical protein
LKVYVTEVGPVTIENGKYRMSITVETQNMGNNPATDVHLGCDMFKTRMFTVSAAETRAPVERTKMFASIGSPGIDLLPEEKYSVSFSAEAGLLPRAEDAVKRQIASGVPESNIRMVLSAAFCAIYKAVASDDWKYSSHALVISRAGGAAFEDAPAKLPVDVLRGMVIPGESRFA